MGFLQVIACPIEALKGMVPMKHCWHTTELSVGFSDTGGVLRTHSGPQCCWCGVQRYAHEKTEVTASDHGSYLPYHLSYEDTVRDLEGSECSGRARVGATTVAVVPDGMWAGNSTTFRY